jgi:hypothetical protein
MIAASLSMLQSTPDERAVGARLPESFVGIWDVSEAACADSASDYRLELAPTQMRTPFHEDGDATVLHEAFSPYHTEVTVKYLTQQPARDMGWWEHYRLVLDDSGDKLFLEALPVLGEEFNFYRRFYVRCSAIEGGAK